MIRILGAILLLAGLVGCAAPTGGAWWRDLMGLSSAPGAYRFDWRIAGDPALAPQQVFDDGRETWLQYPAGQPVPAVFERLTGGDRLLRPRRDGDFLILRGVPQRIVLRGGLSQAEAWRPIETSSLEADLSAPVTTPERAGSAAVAPAMTAHPARPGTPPVSEAVRVTPVAHLPMPAPPPGPASPPAAPVPPIPPAPPVQADSGKSGRAAVAASARRPGRANPLSFEVTPADGNIRRALGRWARAAGWTFGPELWNVDADIPLAGSAVFGDSFRAAVRGLLSATELGDRPVQPCFYANRVLRVVPLAQRCDRTRTPGADA